MRIGWVLCGAIAPSGTQDVHHDLSLEDLVRGSLLVDAMKDKFLKELAGNGLTVAAWWGMSDEDRKELTSPALRLYMQGVLKRTEAGSVHCNKLPTYLECFQLLVCAITC